MVGAMAAEVGVIESEANFKWFPILKSSQTIFNHKVHRE